MSQTIPQFAINHFLALRTGSASLEQAGALMTQLAYSCATTLGTSRQLLNACEPAERRRDMYDALAPNLLLPGAFSRDSYLIENAQDAEARQAADHRAEDGSLCRSRRRSSRALPLFRPTMRSRRCATAAVEAEMAKERLWVSLRGVRTREQAVVPRHHER